MVQPIRVRLSWAELRYAARVGLERQINALQFNRRSRLGKFDADRLWGGDIDGAIGEYVTAKVLGLEWNESTDGPCYTGDVGSIEVRTRRRRDYQLLIRNDDADERRFVLVRGMPPVLDVVGWYEAFFAKRRDWLKDPGAFGLPVYLVPDVALRDLRELPR